MPKQVKIPWRNRSPYHWWLFSEIQQWVPSRLKKLTPRSRSVVWENTRIIKARNRDEAYKKAMRLGREGHPAKTPKGEWRFVGISQLLPIYEPLEDGAEILWHDHGLISVAAMRRLVHSRRQLDVFDDSAKEE